MFTEFNHPVPYRSCRPANGEVGANIAMSIEIQQFEPQDKARLRDFLNVVDDIYRDDPHWVRPLNMDIKCRLDKKKNPFFDRGEATAWVAYQDGRPVGRITAQLDHGHLELRGDDVGFFGFLDTIEDAAVVEQLLAKAEAWLRSKGMKRMRGPLSLNINEDAGCLVDGFDTPPMIMMPHHRPYQAELIEKAGLSKVKDLYAWTYDVGKVPPRAERGHKLITELPEVTVRPLNMKKLVDDMKLFMDIYNDAWSDNWGMVPTTERETIKAAEDLKMIAIPELTRLVFIDGEAAAMAMAVPNVNELIYDLNGRLFPFGFAKMLWRLKVQGPRSVRLFLLGIRQKYRYVRRYAGLSAYLYTEMNRECERRGITRAELSWTLEDNAAINVGIKMMGGRIYKIYRLFEKVIEPSG